MKILVKNGEGQEVNPYVVSPNFPMNGYFGNDAPFYPALGAPDGKHDADLVWKNKREQFEWKIQNS
jgi:hypothetical protein